MASNTKRLSSSSSYEVTLNVNQTSQSVVNNNSVVSWSLVVRKLVGSGYWGADSWASTYSVVIDGVTVSSGQKSYDFRGGAPANFTIASGTRTISHGSDGAKSISASASWKDNANGLGTGAPSLSMALTTIPRASDFTLSPSTVNFGGVTRVSIKKKSSGFTSTVRLSWGTQNITLWDKITWVDGDYTLPTSLTPVNGTTGWGTIHVDTYNGTTLVGTKSARLNGTVPDNSTFNPSATAPTFTEKNTAVSGGMAGQWVAGKSKIEYKATFATRMNATVKSAVFRVVRNGVTFNHTATISGNTATFTESPTVTTTYSVQLVVTDTRGRTAISSASSFTMVAYSVPKLTSVSAVRDNSDSTKILIKATATGSSVSALNTMTLRVFTRLRGAPSWGTAKHVVTSTNGSIVLTNHVLTGYDVLSSYDVLVQLDDELTSATYSQSSVGTSSVLLDAYKDVGLAIGKYYETAIGGALQVGGKAELGETHIDRIVATDWDKVPNDLNNVIKGGTYHVHGNTTANLPEPTWGFLEVIEATPHNILQKYTTRYTNDPKMFYRVRSDNGAWSAWKVIGVTFGSNENGHYIRLNSGFVIGAKTLTFTGKYTNGSGFNYSIGTLPTALRNGWNSVVTANAYDNVAGFSSTKIIVGAINAGTGYVHLDRIPPGNVTLRLNFVFWGFVP